MQSTDRNRLLLGSLLLIATFNYTDRVLLAVFAEPIKRELALSDTQIGVLGGLGFALIYTLFGLVIGRLADRRNRVAIIAVGTVIWSVMTVACGLATGFIALLIARAGVGLGEACFLPPAASLLSDRFAPQKRGGAMAIIQLGSPISLLLAAIATATIGVAWGWRSAFWLIGGAGVFAGIFFALTIRDRRDSAKARAEAGATSFGADVAAILRDPPLRHLMLGGTLALLGMGSIGQFLPPFFARSHGLGVGDAGLLFGGIQFTGAMTGLLIGGFGTDRLARRDPRWRAWLPAAGLTVATFGYLAGFLATSLIAMSLLLVVASTGLLTYLAPTLTLVQERVVANRRAMAIAVYTLVSSILGGGLGPILVGWLSDRFAAAAFAGGSYAVHCAGGIAAGSAQAAYDAACRAAAAAGLNQALLCCALIFAWGAFHFLAAARAMGPVEASRSERTSLS